jgi:hypothetical protein
MQHSNAAEDQVGLARLLCVIGCLLLQEQQMYGLNLLCFDDDQQITGESGPDRLLPYCYYCCHCHQLSFTITLLAAEVVGFRQPLKSEHDHIFKTDSSYMGHLDKLHMDAEH